MSENLRITSKNCPKGEFKFAAVVGQGVLNEDASTKKEDVYEYKTTLELDENDAFDLMDEIDAFVDDNAVKGAELVKVPYQTSEDYDGIPKGKVWLSAKCRTTREDDDGDVHQNNITIFDARGTKVKLPEGTGIGEGSTGKVYGSISVWSRKGEYGATFWLRSVQIADFKPYEFEEQPDTMEGSFSGFDNDLEKDETEPEEETPTRRRRRSRR